MIFTFISKVDGINLNFQTLQGLSKADLKYCGIETEMEKEEANSKGEFLGTGNVK